MCGICGEVTFDGREEGDSLAAMIARMRSRGPDAGGSFSQDRAALGHRRLSIIDLTAASQQPMIDSELGLAIVFNGCIYNYRELRGELAGKGYRFFSHGDTEVILKSYAAWGPRCVERFHGMFASAIWERESGRMVLARGLFNRGYIDRLLANPERELTPKGHSKLWQVALLECWLQIQRV